MEPILHKNSFQDSKELIEIPFTHFDISMLVGGFVSVNKWLHWICPRSNNIQIKNL